MSNLVLYAGIIIIICIVSLPGWISVFRASKVASPSVYSVMEHTIADMSKRLLDMETKRQVDHVELVRMHTELARVGIRLERWMVYAKMLADIIRRNDTPVPPSPDEIAMITAEKVRDEDKSYSVVTLLRRMERTFNLDELADLAFMMDIDISGIAGDTFNARAREFIAYVKRRERLPELVAICRELRPDGNF